MADKEAGRSHFVTVNRCFQGDPYIEELGIVPSPIKCQEEEEAAIVQDHKLGIKMWCVKELYDYSYKKFMQMKNSVLTDDFLDVTRAVLLLNAECYIAWNVRKECALCGKLKIEEDLKFCGLLLTLYPRSVETFIHRRWLLRQYHKQYKHDDDLESLYKHELLLCTITAGKHEANYMSWSHREWVVDTFLARNLKELMSDWKKTEHWVLNHISDHCGFQYKQFLLKTLQPLCNVDHLLSSEFKVTGNTIFLFPGHEAVWNHRRYLVHCYLLWCRPCNGDKAINNATNNVLIQESSILECQPGNESTNLCHKEFQPIVKKRKVHESTAKVPCQWSLENELEFCDKVDQFAGENTSQKHCSDTHRKWIKYITRGETE